MFAHYNISKGDGQGFLTIIWSYKVITSLCDMLNIFFEITVIEHNIDLIDLKRAVS